MTYTSRTNHFFKKSVYKNLAHLAFSPVSWAFESETTNHLIALPDLKKLLIAAVLWPIFLPATIATVAISLALAAVSALVHGLSLLVAGALDASPYSPAPAL